MAPPVAARTALQRRRLGRLVLQERLPCQRATLRALLRWINTSEDGSHVRVHDSERTVALDIPGVPGGRCSPPSRSYTPAPKPAYQPVTGGSPEACAIALRATS